MDKISFAFDSAWLLPAIAGLIIYLILAVLLYRKTNPPFSKKVRIPLGIIRYAALFFVVFCLAEPVLSVDVKKEDEPVVVFLADNSTSIKTVENFEQKREFLEDFVSGDFTSLLPPESNADFYLFSDTLHAAGNLDFEGRQTSLGNVINSIRENYKDKNLAGIIVASDGLSNFGSDPIAASRQAGGPIYAVDLGPQRISKDIRIVDINHEPVAYADKPFELNIELEGRGFEKLSLPVTVSSEGRDLAHKNLEILGQGERQRFKVEVTPTEPGVKNFNIKLPVQPDEELTDNNSRNLSIKVLKSKKRALLAGNKLNWEITFLNRVISSSPDFVVDLAINAAQSRLPDKVFPANQDSLNQYDIIILVNCESQFISSNLNALNAYVTDNGGSLWFILGEKTRGRYPNQASQSVLPFNPRFEDRYYNDFAFHLQLTEEGKIHPVTRLVEDSRENTLLWQSLPPMEEHLVLTQIKPNAQILAVHPEREYADRSVPLIFNHKFGRGKVLTFAAGPIWKIGFLNAGYGEDDFAYRQIITNSVNWLTTEEDIERIRLASDQSIYKSGERVGLSATVLDENYSPLENSIVNVVVKPVGREDSLIVSMVQESPGRFSADLGLLPSGDYILDGRVVWEDKVLKQVSGKFKVEGFSLEEETLFLPPDMMQKISQAAGGKRYTIADFENISEDLSTIPRFRTESYETRIAGNIWVLIIILALLSIEWMVRKRLQLL
ncbi:MAG TPA: hypothetical protein ENO22_08800 [candidate division Zixibacteria bacterium]|nr:hypothetical protein [candidate division Zixibacteria bacterium]HEQ99420.1 hypothetical protein [candidate division Zixibacteria bacterium]